MTSKPLHDQSASGGDIAKYALALLLAVGGLVAFYWFDGQWPTVARVLVLLVGLVLGVVVFMATAKGVETREFLSESRFELRKVVWPTREEALRMTWVVAIVVVVMSLMLGGFDWVIQALLKLFFTIGR